MILTALPPAPPFDPGFAPRILPLPGAGASRAPNRSSILPIRSSATDFQFSRATIEAGPDIRWRRDYLRGIETGLRYFRRIPYLDTAARRRPQNRSGN